MKKHDEEKIKQMVVNGLALTINCVAKPDFLERFKDNKLAFLRDQIGMKFPTDYEKANRIFIHLDCTFYRWPKVIFKTFCKEEKEDKNQECEKKNKKKKFIYLDEAMRVTKDWWEDLVEENEKDLIPGILRDYPQAKQYENIKGVIDELKRVYPGSPEEALKELEKWGNWENTSNIIPFSKEKPSLFIIIPFLSYNNIPPFSQEKEGGEE